MYEFDSRDIQLLNELRSDGAVSIPHLAKKMGVNASVLYSRINRMTERGLIRRFTVDIDDAVIGYKIRATIGINRDPISKEAIHDALMKIPEIVSVAEVTGRFDILAILHARNLEELHTIVIQKIGDIDGIQNTETLVELQKQEKPMTYRLEGAKKR